MPHPNAVLENVFGTIGAVLWSIQIIPQIWKSYRTKDTEGLSTFLMFIWALAGFFLGTYAIVQNINIPIILQPQLFSTFAALSTAQCLYYNHKKSRTFCWIFFVGFCVCFGAFEAGMTFALRAGLKNGTNAPVLLFGVLSAVLLAGALLPQYWEIYKFKEVKGISMTFMAVDMAGGVFCIMSLAFKENLDILATINYAAVVLLDGIVVFLAIVLNPRMKRQRARGTGTDTETPLPPPSLPAPSPIDANTNNNNKSLEKRDTSGDSSIPSEDVTDGC
ncbi:hypothetical protein QFC21_001792 [Naganishia friedmannii]|uniref:Uncharacterized protein n=1 Tax=Naganishia friedmannii TaxID=89922 RepID=A0ACC2W2Y5_9TREE|nr:hypothetical protein QFC21_001792 [Naganishia friedmannii]